MNYFASVGYLTTSRIFVTALVSVSILVGIMETLIIGL